MSMRGFRRAVGLWWAATIHGVANAWFGWGAVAAAVFIGFLQQHPGLIKNIDQAQWWWFLPVVGVFAALLLVSSIHALLIAPYRAWRMLKPFEIEVVSGMLESEYPAEPFERQRAAISIKNKSYRQHTNCVSHVQTVSGLDNQHHSFPRFIKEFSLQPGETKQIEILTWTARKAPHENDKQIVLSGPVGWGWGGNFVALPCGSSYDMEIRIGVPDSDPTRVFCRVWIEGDELKAAKQVI